MPGHYGKKKKAKMGYMEKGGQALFNALKKKGYKKQGGKVSYMKAGGLLNNLINMKTDPNKLKKEFDNSDQVT